MLGLAGLLLVLAGVAAFKSDGFIALVAKPNNLRVSDLHTGNLLCKAAGAILGIFGLAFLIV